MTRLLHALAMAALIFLAMLSLDARLAGVRADDVADCVGKGSVDAAIRGCSRIIKSGRLIGEPISKGHLAGVYNNRGVAYRKKGQYDCTIADYTQVIKIDPHPYNLYQAYYNRGLAYEKLWQLSGGGPTVQRDKAIADFRKAIELRPGDETATSGLKRLGVVL